ncbi:hypothetical protein F4859DRAFT_528589 [Xylaria cf. heliscus]|nr:hypothetical protein F4859DRAFT_528589 [Xylaria cf. heliscus]
MSHGMASSIFEYLTCKNPDLKYETRMEYSLSREDWWLTPKRLVLTRWTKPMVTIALEAIDDIFHPVFWAPSSLADAPSIATLKAQPEVERGGENGYWQKNKTRSREASPCREIPAVRVGPSLESRVLGPSESSKKGTEQKLSEAIYYQGVTEYAIVPWENYRTKGRYENMKINLTLWLLCILAGQDYRPDWYYEALLEEQLIRSEKYRKKPTRVQSALD